MKTLDEVITALEGSARSGIKDDAIAYLKAYKEDKDDLTALRAYWKEQQENPALTWDELKQMEGKPVWLESHGDISEFTGWAIVSNVLKDRMRFIFSHYDGDFLTYEMSLPDCTFNSKWQAYRKERYESTDRY